MTRDRILAFVAFVLATVSAVLPWMADMGSYLLGWDGDIKGTQIPIGFLIRDFDALEDAGSGSELSLGAVVIAIGVLALAGALMRPRIRRIILWVSGGLGSVAVAIFLLRLSAALDALEASDGLLAHTGIGVWVFCVAIVVAVVAGFLVRTTEDEEEAAYEPAQAAPLPGETAARAAFGTAQTGADSPDAAGTASSGPWQHTPYSPSDPAPTATSARENGSSAAPIDWQPPPPSSDSSEQRPALPGDAVPAEPSAEGAPDTQPREASRRETSPGEATPDRDGARWEATPEQQADRMSGPTTATPWLTSDARENSDDG